MRGIAFADVICQGLLVLKVVMIYIYAVSQFLVAPLSSFFLLVLVSEMATVKNEVSSIPSSGVQAKTRKCKPPKATSQGRRETENSIPENVPGSSIGTNEERAYTDAEQQQAQRKDQPGPLSTER